jgi:DNA-binding transcriptional MocR family regulator
LLSLPGSLRRVKWYGMIKGLLVLRSWVSLIISHENKFAMYADQIYIFTYFQQFP